RFTSRGLYGTPALQPLQQLDLPGVIEVVRRDAANRVGRRVAAVPDDARHRPRRQAFHHLAQPFVFFREQPHIVVPGAIAGWPNEPVGTSERKSLGAAARQPLPDDVLPVRRVDDELPDAVAPAARSPRRLFRPHAAERRGRRGPVPWRPRERFGAIGGPDARTSATP